MDIMSLFAMAPAMISKIGQLFGVDMSSDESKAKALEAQVQLQQMIADAAMSQAATNTEEAKNPNLFVSGWRPFVGWVCASVFAYHFLLQPLIIFIMVANGCDEPDLPILDLDASLSVLMGMLGLGAMRTYEKTQGVARR